MAKKNRRQRRAELAGEGQVAPRRRTPEERMREEYAYVLRDLRHVFVLAAIMFTLLIVLNLLI